MRDFGLGFEAFVFLAGVEASGVEAEGTQLAEGRVGSGGLGGEVEGGREGDGGEEDGERKLHCMVIYCFWAMTRIMVLIAEADSIGVAKVYPRVVYQEICSDESNLPAAL